MKKFLEKVKQAFHSVVDWFKQSNRWKHLLGGFAIGLLSLSFYNGIFASLVVGGALEFKDLQWGGKFDWFDLLSTVIGGALGSFMYLFIHF